MLKIVLNKADKILSARNTVLKIYPLKLSTFNFKLLT